MAPAGLVVEPLEARPPRLSLWYRPDWEMVPSRLGGTRQAVVPLELVSKALSGQLQSQPSHHMFPL
ncbi:hypothetical protein GW17_00044446, partial [Ensete ventricosum]